MPSTSTANSIPEPGIKSRMLRFFLGSIIFIQITFPPTLMAQSQGGETESSTVSTSIPTLKEYIVAKAKLARMFGLLKQARLQLNRSTFDPDILLDSLDYDAKNIINFVKNDVHFEQYLGLLRGPVGTLMGHAGNALDQSVLLAKLLNDAGFEARIAEGSLTLNQANLLFQTSLSSVQENISGTASPELLETMRELNRLSGKPNSDLTASIDSLGEPFQINSSNLYAQVRASSDLIKSGMEAILPGFSTPKVQPEIVKETQNYYWVQYRELSSHTWKDIHAVLPEAVSFDSPIKAMGYLSGSVPEEMQHLVRFEAKIEQSLNGKRVVHDLMQPWQRPAANMMGIPLTYTNHPNSLNSKKDYLDVRGALLRAQLYYPTFNGSLPSGGKAFDDKGQLIDPDAASNQAAGVFKNVGDAFGKATSTLGSGPPMKLTRHWLVFTFISPDGKEKSIERTIFDVRSKDDTDPLDLAVKLSQEHTFMVSTGNMSEDFALEQILQRIESSEIMLSAIMERSYFLQKPIELSQQDLKSVKPQWWGHYLLFPSFASEEKMEGKNSLYVSSPQLVMYSEYPPIGKGQKRTIDIVRNERRALQLKNGKVHNAPTEMVIAGVWDTAVEGLALTDKGRKSLNTFISMEGAQKDGIKIILPKDAKTIENLGLNTQVLENLHNDLENGYAVILSASSPETISGWWRVDPATGETLGILYTGQGSEFTEALSLISGTISFGFWLNGLAGCVGGAVSGGSEAQFSCCVAVNSAFWIGGGVVGAYAGVTGLISSLGAFAGDMVYNMATAQINLCGS